MAILQTSKPLSLLPLLAFITMIFLMRVNSDESISFSFDEFEPDHANALVLQGDATINGSTKVLQLTKIDSSGKPVGNSVGRVLYLTPVHIWKSSAVVANFETTFAFVVKLVGPPIGNIPADGLTFFLASPNTTILPNSTGGLLGLFNDSLDPSNSPDKVVAVEIDTFVNDEWDPKFRHIGIDVNSIKSKANSSWVFQNGTIATVHIAYNSASKRLSAVLTYPNTDPVTVSYELELNTVLPEWVRVGFSASTGARVEINHILFWSFKSTLEDNKEDSYIATVV